MLWSGPSARSQTVMPPSAAAQRHQEQQLDAVTRQAADTPDVLTPRAAGQAGVLRLPAETPCVDIATVEWRGAESFPWLATQSPGEGACVGGKGLEAIRAWATHELVARGYVTTLVAVPAQSLADGHLILEVLPGRIGRIVDGSGSLGRSGTLLPRSAGRLLNVRDLDQAIENIRRLPGQAATAFDLVPGESVGESDIQIRHPADARRVRLILTADNGGLNATGRNQFGAIVAIDSPLGLYDQLIATVNNDANPGHAVRGSRSRSVAWNVPFGYGSFSIGASEWATRQPLDGLGADLVYARRTRRLEAGIGYVPYRSSHGKSMVRFKLVKRSDRSWLAGEALQVQRHDITSYDVSAAHHEKFARASVEAGVGMRGSLAGLSGFPGYVHGQSNWSGRYRVVTTNVAIDAPFEAAGHRLGYRGTFVLQHAPVPVPSTECLQIGGRYTVRGFDGNRTLVGRGGWVARNEAAARAFGAGEAYLALDAGQAWGDFDNTGSRLLVGAALGLRGGYRWFGYDVALGVPIRKPASLSSPSPTLDVQLTARF
ncbi:ShlB/FhaC/HecB family hemolysin secretion/activation protein [Burkholderia alba]|uniref:ShlB/FhaC/HecB family hemolysin secretion/activation protein n=1 Tax=Burkholderia alba TaxID=2683677 RepID=UPI002B054C02|nr:ShlB/FhaC/HecB family hemolysin secretion/activation protein [Burkholderia alba]